MKIVRTWLLLLLVALLPFRGATAAATLCPSEDPGGHGDVQMHGHHGHHGHDIAGTQADEHRSADAALHHDHHGPDHQEKCSLCSACCAGVPLTSAAPRVPEPYGAARASFPALATPVVGFVSERQERPPRSI